MAQAAQDNPVTMLRDQHEMVRNLMTQVEQSAGESRKQAFEPLVRLLAVHETAEEMVIYPAIRGDGQRGDSIAGRRVEEEDRAKKLLTDLEKMDPTSVEFEQLFTTLRSAVEAHASGEEREVFPLVEQITDEQEKRRMAAALKVAEGIAPTHPHKNAPESAVGNLLVGPFVSMVDRARDAIRDAIH